MRSERLFTSNEVSKKLGIQPSTVREYAGIFGVGMKIAGRLFFTPTEVKAIKSRCTKRGRPKKGESRGDPIRRVR